MDFQAEFYEIYKKEAYEQYKYLKKNNFDQNYIQSILENKANPLDDMNY